MFARSGSLARAWINNLVLNNFSSCEPGLLICTMMCLLLVHCSGKPIMYTSVSGDRTSMLCILSLTHAAISLCQPPLHWRMTGSGCGLLLPCTNQDVLTKFQKKHQQCITSDYSEDYDKCGAAYNLLKITNSRLHLRQFSKFSRHFVGSLLDLVKLSQLCPVAIVDFPSLLCYSKYFGVALNCPGLSKRVYFFASSVKCGIICLCNKNCP